MAAALNDTFYPILLSSMQEPLSISEIEAYFKTVTAIADRGIRMGTRHVVIVTSGAKITPASRKHLSEVQSRYLTAEQNNVTLASFLPVDNPVVRGLLTAMRWISPELVKSVRIVDSLQSALNDALQALEASGAPFTGDQYALRRALGLIGLGSVDAGHGRLPTK